ncbi:uncharacterized protein [Aegilops tauschii subsp. strangulata]|uniref:XS domain-containing protein n=1 Tax=Aegilops tauschii subsp. strangulata TaxID=200361 RepID=A0A453K7G4_AEGTS|nr:uncharacterized protein LOC109779183 [Aegilops tauschii subsp. strangulata]
MGRRGGRGGGGVGGRGRRDERPGGGRDIRGMRDRRPDDMGIRDRRPENRPRCSAGRSPSPAYRPRRSPRSCSPSPGYRPRGPSPHHRLRRSRSPDHRGRRSRDDDGEHNLPRRGQGDYGREPFHQERDRCSPRGSHDGRGDRGSRASYVGRSERGPNRNFDSRGDCVTSGRYDAPPDYMLPEHPYDQGRAAKNASDFFGGPGDRSINNEDGFYGDDTMKLRVSSTGLGRSSSMYLDSRSPLPPPPTISLAPRTMYPSVPLRETGFLTGSSMVKGGESLGAGSTRLPQDDTRFHYHDHLPGPYVGNREIERLGPSRDVLSDRDRELDRLYSSRGVYGSDITPSMQLKRYAGSSPSVLAKDSPYRVHGGGYEPSHGYTMDNISKPGSLGHGSGQVHRFSESSLEHLSGHDDKISLDITSQTHSKYPPTTASMEYDADGYGRRGPENDTYFAFGNFRGNCSRDSRSSPRHTLVSSPLTDLKDERSNAQVRLSRRMGEDAEYNTYHNYHRDTPTDYPKPRNAHIRYSRSPETYPLELARQPVRQREFASLENGCQSSHLEVSPVAYRRGSRGAAYSTRDMDMYQADGPLGPEYYNDEIGLEHYNDEIDPYDLSPEKLSRRSCDIIDDEDGYDARYDMSSSRNVFSRIALPDNMNDEWIDAEEGNHPHPNGLAHGRLKYKPMSQRLSRPIVQPQIGGSAMLGRGRGGGWTKSAKKRLRVGLPQFHGGYTSERNESVRPNKFTKLSEDNQKRTEPDYEDAPDEVDLSVQKDPPEGSEEFSKQVHQAFLKFSKILNESPTMQKRYREAPKGSLSCRVCGSVARKFPDIDALMSHAYDTHKPGLKTKHLGFHKALCVLMGWNWHVAPDTSKAYQSVPAEEVNAMKRDLMVWPPVVLIHNSSITNKAKVSEAKIVTIEEIEGVLADIGVACDKAKITQGRPANQSVFVVKFLPTISGFQEAMRIHDHFSSENHGKEELHQILCEKGKSSVPADKLEELLHAHIALAEDLGYLDDETKKRCVVRSKNDIEARADATLNLDS